MSAKFSWQEVLVLKAMAPTSWLSWIDMGRCNVPHGVYRKLIRRGLIIAPPSPRGYEITQQGKEAVAQLELQDEQKRRMDRRGRRAA
jgi:hypothetical protein